MSGESRWESLSAEEIDKRFSALELVHVLKAEPFNLDSSAYFMKKADRIRYLREPDARADILEEIAEVKAAHRKRNRDIRRERLTKPSEAVISETEGREFRFIESSRVEGGFEDDLTGRRAAIAYVIEDVGDGSRLRVGRGSANTLHEAGRLDGFTGYRAPAGSRRSRFAHAAGAVTAADVFDRNAESEDADSAQSSSPSRLDASDDAALEELLGSLE